MFKCGYALYDSLRLLLVVHVHVQHKYCTCPAMTDCMWYHVMCKLGSVLIRCIWCASVCVACDVEHCSPCTAVLSFLYMDAGLSPTLNLALRIKYCTPAMHPCIAFAEPVRQFRHAESVGGAVSSQDYTLSWSCSCMPCHLTRSHCLVSCLQCATVCTAKCWIQQRNGIHSTASRHELL